MLAKKHETLDDIIQETGLKYEKIAERMGITVNWLWRLRKEPKKMDALDMEKLADALGVGVNRVFEAIKNFES